MRIAFKKLAIKVRDKCALNFSIKKLFIRNLIGPYETKVESMGYHGPDSYCLVGVQFEGVLNFV